MSNQYLSPQVTEFMEKITALCGTENPKWAAIFNHCFTNTLQSTVKELADGSTYVLTGDIPAMWLRDSVAQVRPYLVLAKVDPEIRKMIRGLVKRQFTFISIDPYANAFNETPNGAGHQEDQTEMSPWIWERKYEVDSLCYPIQLAYLFYLQTGDTQHFDRIFLAGVDKIIALWQIEQDHSQSSYRFTRDTWRKEDTLTENGLGSKVGLTGMTWSGFRPSDDACTYHYLVPSNMFAVVVLGYLEVIFETILRDRQRKEQVTQLKKEIQQGIEAFALIANANGETVYAYEVDGLGHQVLMDDANIPSLLSAAYLGYCDKNDPRYLKTRQTILSQENPYFYSGHYAQGIGSSHTPENYVWHMAMAMEGLTATTKKEKADVLNLMASTDAGTNAMHEGFDVNQPKNYTREWFSWPNMMFCELVMDYYDIKIKIN